MLFHLAHVARREAVREVQVRGGGHFWGGLAAALGCAPADLVYWGKARPWGASHRLGLRVPARPCIQSPLILPS